MLIKIGGGENTKIDNRLMFALIISMLLIFSINSVFAEDNETNSDIVSSLDDSVQLNQLKDSKIYESDEMLKAGNNVINVHVKDTYNETGKNWIEDGFNLANATVNVYDSSKVFISTHKTNSNGKVVINNLNNA